MVARRREPFQRSTVINGLRVAAVHVGHHGNPRGEIHIPARSARRPGWPCSTGRTWFTLGLPTSIQHGRVHRQEMAVWTDQAVGPLHRNRLVLWTTKERPGYVAVAAESPVAIHRRHNGVAARVLQPEDVRLGLKGPDLVEGDLLAVVPSDSVTVVVPVGW